jgi:hypothetical protein
VIGATLKDEIIHITLEGSITYEEFLAAVGPILDSGRKYVGFISDGRKMATLGNAQIQLQLEQHHRTYNSDKRNAILMDPYSGKAMLAKVYIAFTKAQNTQLFTDEEEAIAWVREGAAGT